MKKLNVVVVTCLAVCIMFCGADVSAQGCPEIVGTAREPSLGEAQKVQLSGSHAFIQIFRDTCGTQCPEHSIAITDVSDPSGPRIVSMVDVSGGGSRWFSRFAVTPTRMYHVVNGYDRFGGQVYSWLHTTDVTDPVHPTLVARHELQGETSAIDVVGRHVYLAIRDRGLEIIDVASPNTPVEVGLFEDSWHPSEIAVAKSYAFIAVRDEGLRIIDVSDPANPAQVGALSAAWEARELSVVNGFVYVAAGPDGLWVIDVSDPANPTESGHFQTVGEARGLAAQDAWVAVATGDGGVQIIDVGTPAEPVEVALYPPGEFANDVAAGDGVLFAALGRWEADPLSGGFRVVDMANEMLPLEVGTFQLHSSAQDVIVSEGSTYVADGDLGLWVQDLATGWTTSVDTPGFASGVASHGQHVLVADGHKGLRVIDAADVDGATEVGFVDTPGSARRVAVAGDHAYVADGPEGLRVIDLSTPAKPEEIGSLQLPGETVDVLVTGDHAFVASEGLRVIDISDPARPVEVADYGGAPVRALELSGTYLLAGFRASPAEGHDVVVLDVSEPTAPKRVGSFLSFGEITNVSVAGNWAYVTTRRGNHSRVGGVQVFDLSDPTRAVEVGALDIKGDAMALAVSGAAIHLAAESRGVPLLDARCLTTSWLEIASRGPGRFDSEWRTDVIVTNGMESDANLEFVLHTRDGDFTTDALVSGPGQGVFEDIVGLMEYEGKGVLEVRADQPVKIQGRVYSQSESGTVGQLFPGYRSSEGLTSSASAWLFGLRQIEGEFRTNLSFSNIGSSVAGVSVRLFRSDGRELQQYYIRVAPGDVFQDVEPIKNRALQPNLGWGYARVEVGPESKILTSASVIDSRTNDAVTVPMSR